MIVNEYLADPRACELDERRITRTSRPSPPASSTTSSPSSALSQPAELPTGTSSNASNAGNGGSGAGGGVAGSSPTPSPEETPNGNGSGNGGAPGDDWRERYRFEAKLPMLPKTKVFRPRDLNLERVEFGAEGFLFSNELDVEGFRHFQVCFEVTDGIGNVNVAVAKGIYRFPEVGVKITPAGPDFVSQGTSPFVPIGTISAPSTTEYHSLYFGAELLITGLVGDTIRFGRTITLSFENQLGPGTTLSAWLECST